MTPGHRLPSLSPDQVASKVANVQLAGDALAAAAIAVPGLGLGLVRSFTAPALLAGGWYAAASWAAVAIGFAFAALTWLAASGPGRVLLHRAAWDHPWPWMAIVGAPFLVAVGWLLFWPLEATHVLGVLGTVVIGLGTLTVVLAVLAYAAQTRQPVPLFRILRLNVTPVLAVIVVVGVLGGAVDSKSLLHTARGPVPGQAATQQWGAPGTTFLDALHSWLSDRTDSAACALPAGHASVTRSAAHPGSRRRRRNPRRLVGRTRHGQVRWYPVRAARRLRRQQRKRGFSRDGGPG